MLLIILLLLVGGAIINVAVAWGCAFGPPLSWGLSSGPKLVQPVVPPSPAGESLDAEASSGTMGVNIHERLRVPPLVLVTVVFAGWPMHGLTGTVIDDDHRSGAVFVPEWTGLSRRDNGDQRVLPLTPVWPGFAINTVLYAAVLWVMFAALSVMRRWHAVRRTRRGLCVKCGYPIGNSPLCTECGATVERRTEKQPSPAILANRARILACIDIPTEACDGEGTARTETLP